MSKNCALLKPKCKRSVVNDNKPFEFPQCPLNDIISGPNRPKCPLIPQPCPLSCKPPPCPGLEDSTKTKDCPVKQKEFECPMKSFLSKSKCEENTPRCPLEPIQCPLNNPPSKCPTEQDDDQQSCCPLNIPQIPQCPLTPPKCPLDKNVCLPNKNESCDHKKFLEKSLTLMPPHLGQEFVKRCPFEPKPIMCNELCPCTNVPDVFAGPRCPFLPDDPPPCPPMCPLASQPESPLTQRPNCFWKPLPPPQCPLTSQSSSPSNLQKPFTESCKQKNCRLNELDVCPSFLSLPGNPKNAPKRLSSNINSCPFCECKPLKATAKCENSRTFHIPSCPMFKTPPELKKLPIDKPVCPFYPCPCPLSECGDCPLKLCPLKPTTFESDTDSAISSCPENVSTNCPTFSSREKPDDCSQSKSPIATFPVNFPLSTPPPKNCPCPPKSLPLPSCPPTDCNLPPPSPPSNCCSPSNQVNYSQDNLVNKPPPVPLPLPCPIKGCLKKQTSTKSGGCSIKTGSCAMFPEGKCPMGDMGLCDCNYPVPSCMLDLETLLDTTPAPPQYCLKQDCCMGLPDPPVVPDSQSKDQAYYSFVPLNPGSHSTKYYVDICDDSTGTPDITSMFPQKVPLRPQCSILKHGEGFKQCKSVKKILEKRGCCEDTGTQCSQQDCLPIDEASRRVRESRIMDEEKMRQNKSVKIT